MILGAPAVQDDYSLNCSDASDMVCNKKALECCPCNAGHARSQWTQPLIIFSVVYPDSSWHVAFAVTLMVPIKQYWFDMLKHVFVIYTQYSEIWIPNGESIINANSGCLLICS